MQAENVLFLGIRFLVAACVFRLVSVSEALLVGLSLLAGRLFVWLRSFREGDWARAEQTVCRESCDAITGDHPSVRSHMTEAC